MNNYNQVLATAKDLQEEFGNKLTVAESLHIAAQINLAECINNGLQPGQTDVPNCLEAIAISLGFGTKQDRVFSKTVADSLQMLVSKESL